MVAGMDRYYQVVRCFRDEDLRADRQPEFTQLDIETSFMTEDEIMVIMEEMIRQLFKKIINVDLDAEFPRMSYRSMSRFGIDRRSPYPAGIGGYCRGHERRGFQGILRPG